MTTNEIKSKLKIGIFAKTRYGNEGLVFEVDGEIVTLKRPTGGKTYASIRNIVQINGEEV